MSAKSETFAFLDTLTDHTTFTGHELMKIMNRLTNEKHYAATYLRYLREWRAVDGRSVPNVSKRKSLYEIKSA